MELHSGRHTARERERCLFEVVSQFKGRVLTDDPSYVPRPLRMMGTLLNDYLDFDNRQRLIPFITPLQNVHESETADQLVREYTTDYLYRVAFPAWVTLALPKLQRMPLDVDELRDLLDMVPGVRDPAVLDDPSLLGTVQMVYATIRPAATINEVGDGDRLGIALSVCRHAAIHAHSHGDQAKISAVYCRLVDELIDLYDLCVGEYQNE